MIGMRLGERPREKVKISKEFSGISAGLCAFHFESNRMECAGRFSHADYRKFLSILDRRGHRQSFRENFSPGSTVHERCFAKL